MSEQGGQDRIRHGPVARLLLVFLGTLFCVAGFGLGVVVPIAAFRASSSRLLPTVGAGILFLIVFGSIASYGVALIVRGGRGFSTSGQLVKASVAFERFNRGWAFVVCAGFGLVIWLATHGRVPHERGLGAVIGWYFSLGCLLFLFAAGPHELGHALAARALGVEVKAIRVWPFVLRRDDRRRLRIAMDWQPPGDLIGSVYWSADRIVEPTTHLVIVLGGPVANGVTGILLTVAANTVGSVPGHASGLGALLWSAAFANLAALVGNLVPRRFANGMLTDGGQLLNLRRPDFRARWVRDLLLSVPPTNRPREWGVSFQELLEMQTGDPGTRSWLRLLALGVALDREEFADARRVLDSREGPPTEPPNVAAEFELQRALVAALLDAAPELARASVSAALEHGIDRDYADLARAAILQAEGKPEHATQTLAHWRARLGTHPGWQQGNAWALERLAGLLAP